MLDDVAKFFKKKGAVVDIIGNSAYITIGNTDVSLLYEFDGFMSDHGFTLEDVIPPDIVSPTYMRIYTKDGIEVRFEYVEFRGLKTVMPVKVTIDTLKTPYNKM